MLSMLFIQDPIILFNIIILSISPSTGSTLGTGDKDPNLSIVLTARCWSKHGFMNVVRTSNIYGVFGLFHSSVPFLPLFVRDNENQRRLLGDLQYLRNSTGFCVTAQHFLLPVWFIKWLNPILECFRVLFFQSDDLSAPATLWLGKVFTAQVFTSTFYVSEPVLMLGTQHSAKSINTLSSQALCSSRKDKR